MRHVTVNFIRFAPAGHETSGVGEAALRRATCLVENAEHLRRHGHARGTGLDIVLVGDVAAVSPAIRASLDREPCRVRDAQPEYEALVARFPRLLAQFGGPYSVFGFGFLRWLLVDRLFPGEPVLCYDGDILHNVPLDDLGRAFAGHTTTATSTCFAAISDRRWFRVWEDALVRLEADAGLFQRLRAAGRARGFDPLASPEESLAKVLIESNLLPQDTLPADFPYWIVPQPHLLPRLYNFVRTRGTPARVEPPIRYARDGASDRLNDRPVAFWHLQKPFLNQLSALLLFRESMPGRPPTRMPPLSLYGRVPTEEFARSIDPYHDEAGVPLVAHGQQDLCRRMIQAEAEAWKRAMPPERNPFAPDRIARYFFHEHDLGLLFNDRTWPVAGVWA